MMGRIGSWAASAAVLCAVALSGEHCMAQSQPWPGDPPKSASAAPWPGDPPKSASAPWPGGPPKGASSAPWPTDQPSAGAATPAPMIGSPLGGGAPGGFGSAGPGAMGAGPMSARPPAGDQAACADEFQRLGGELGKRKQATDATFKRNAPPPDRCKAITEFAAAMGKMLKFVKDKRAACGIPQNLEDTLVKNNAALQTAKTKICAAGPMQGAPAAPSLSDALGTTRLPTPEATKPNLATGTLNTLTGTALGGR